MLISVVLFSLSLLPGAKALELGTPDYSVAAGGRSMPLGAAVSGQLGYGTLLWGEGPRRGSGGADEPNFRYGFLRPALRLQTSGVVNKAEVSLAVHPISFLGLVLGHSQGVRYTDTYTVDCAAAACRGGLQSTFAKGSLVVGYERYFIGGALRADQLLPSVRSRPFVEEGSALVGTQGGDRLVAGETFAGVRLGREYAAGLLYVSERMTGAGTSNEHQSVFARWKRGAWAATAGAGLYESTTQSRSLTVYGAIVWTGLPSLELQ